MTGFDPATWQPLPRRAAGPRGDHDAFVAWALAGGAWLDPIEVVVDAAGNRAVRARRGVAAGELLCAVPRALMVTDVDVDARAEVAMLRRVEVMMQTRHSTLAAWLALEIDDPTSRWRPFLATLPPSFAELPGFRSAAELAALRGTRALDVAVERAAGCVGDRQFIGDLVPDLADLPLADFAWARAVFGSRCFGFDDGGDDGERALVPIVELFDHARPCDAAWDYQPDLRQFEVRALRAIDAGEWINVSYGAHDNAVMLMAYGFATPGNPEDEARLVIETPEGVHVAPIGTHFDPRFQLAISAAYGWPDSTDADALARIAAAAAAADRAIAGAPPPPPGDPGWAAQCQIVRAGERAVLAEVQAFVAQLLADGPTRPRAVWQAIVDRGDPAATGAARLLRGYAQAQLARRA